MKKMKIKKVKLVWGRPPIDAKATAKLRRYQKKCADKVAAGKSIMQVAKEEGVAYSTIHTYCHRFGINPTDLRRKRQAEAMELIRNGVAVEKVARKFKMTQDTLCTYCRHAGLSFRVSKCKRVAEAVELVRNGVALAKAARKYKMAESTLRLYCRAAGLNLRKTTQRRLGGWYEERDKSIKKMRRKGATLQKIGEEVGLTRERVRQILVREN